MRRIISKKRQRDGAILVWVALVFPLLLGITGLVIDAGLLMAAQRHVQNSVDAAAMAGAKALSKANSTAQVVEAATMFVHVHHGLPNAQVDVHSPPVNGPYAGEPGYVEVLAEYDTPTIFMQFLNGKHSVRTARARAVAGAELVELIDGVIALDPSARAGLTVTGNAQFKVTGRIIVNSEGGGLASDGSSIENDGGGVAAFVSPFASVQAREVHLVGGVNRNDRFSNIEPGGDYPLRTGQLPVPDPFVNLPTPTIRNGVIAVRRGAPHVTPGQMTLNNPHDNSDSPNQIVTDELTGEQTMILQPGIYDSIDITGGRVRFVPGIYVLAAAHDVPYSVRILAGEIEAQGIMFYNTRAEYDPLTGSPDAFDGNLLPGENGSSNSGQIRINAELGFSAIDTLQYDYQTAATSISQFNGILIYQRRRSRSTVQIQGFTDEGSLSGVVYAKWGNAKLPAGGVFNSQFVVGSIAVPGHGDLTLNYDGPNRAQSRQIFLVE